MLRLLFVTTEIDDFVRTGGLAAVSAALPRVLRSWSDTRILLPGYGEVVRRLHNLRIVGKCEPLGAMPACDIGAGETADGLPFYVVICPQLYERPGTPYVDENGRDWPDNDIRFARLASVAASLAAGHLDPAWRADVVHLNDWQSALAPAYLSWNGARIPSVLTIHNLAFQGLFERETLYRIGAPESAFHIEGLEFYGKVSFLKAGLQYATHLTTVSETYAREITLPEFGCGLDGVLRKRAANGELTGIVNGIDDSWNSKTCTQLASPFASGDWKRKHANKSYLRKQFGLAVSRGPLFGLVARLVHQKGVDFVLEFRRDHRRIGRPNRCFGPWRNRNRGGLAQGSGQISEVDRRIDRLRRRRSAPHLRRKRFYIAAVPLRTVRAEPNVRAALWLASDRTQNGRLGGNHQGRANRLPISSRLNGVVHGRGLSRLWGICRLPSPKHYAFRRHGAGVPVVAPRGVVPIALSEGLQPFLLGALPARGHCAGNSYARGTRDDALPHTGAILAPPARRPRRARCAIRWMF